MTAAKKTVAAKKVAPAKKLTIKKTSGKIAVKGSKVDQKALAAVLDAHIPIIGEPAPKVADKPAPAPAKRAVVKADKPVVETKADKARTIFKRMAGKTRKEILIAFVAAAGLTVAGAATYYSNFKKQG